MTDDEKLDVIIFIVSAGPNVPAIGKDVLRETIDSIDENIGDDVKYTYFHNFFEIYILDLFFVEHPKLKEAYNYILDNMF